MHIPDGVLSVPVWAALDVALVPAVAFAARDARMRMEEGRTPLLGAMGAFVFAAQMINFPVGAGTSSHLLGGMLLAVTVGPCAATLVLTAILLLQAMLFQDGGILALGANTFNMAVAGVWLGYLPYRQFAKGGHPKLGIFLGSVISVLVGAGCMLLELALSGHTFAPGLIGVSAAGFCVTAALEGLITMSVVASLAKMQPDLLRHHRHTGNTNWWRLATGILAVATLLAGVGAMFASALPDSFEWLAEQGGMAMSSHPILHTPLADYEWSALTAEWPRKASAGLAGVGAIYLLCLGLGRILARQRSA